MIFAGYTYKAGVEAEKSMLVNVLKELDQVSDQQFEKSETEQSQPTQQYLMTENSERSGSNKHGDQMHYGAG